MRYIARVILAFCLLFGDATYAKKKRSSRHTQPQSYSQLVSYDKSNYPARWENISFSKVIDTLDEQSSREHLIQWCNAIRDGIENDFYGEAHKHKHVVRAIEKMHATTRNPKLERELKEYDKHTRMLEQAQTALKGYIDACNTVDLCNSLDGFMQLGVTPHEQFLAAWQQRCAKLLPTRERPIDFSRPLHTIVKHDLPVSESFLGAWLKHSYDHMGNFDAPALASSIKDLAMLKERKALKQCTQDPSDWIQKWFDVSRSHMHTFSKQNIRDNIWAIATLSEQPPYSWLRETYAIFVTLDRIRPHASIATAYHLTKLHINAPTQDQARYLSHMARDLLRSVKVSEICKDAHQQQARWMLLYYNFADWDTIPITSSRERGSTLEDDIYQIIDGMRDELLEAPKYHFYEPNLDTTVDIAFPSSNVIIEIDGPTHFVDAQCKQRDPKDCIKDILLKKSGWEHIIRISHIQWRKCRDKQQYIRALLDKYNLLPRRNRPQKARKRP